MSGPGAVRYEATGAVARITFDRPRARNAMTWTMYDELAAALDQLEADRSVRVAELRGSGGHFVSGTDIKQFETFTSGDEGVEYERRLETIVAKLEHVPVPTIAVVQGHAAGAGLLFATACDLRICTPDAQFSAPIARTVGNTLSARSIARLVAHLGVDRTKTLLMTAGVIEADAARAIGFVGAVVEPERLERYVADLVAKLSQLAPLTLRATKELVQRVLSSSGEQDDADVVRAIYGSRDFREGIDAFREKRSPRWEGR
jgi:enoyl-CoA hydratase/carnithine racemase